MLCPLRITSVLLQAQHAHKNARIAVVTHAPLPPSAQLQPAPATTLTAAAADTQPCSALACSKVEQPCWVQPRPLLLLWRHALLLLQLPHLLLLELHLLHVGAAGWDLLLLLPLLHECRQHLLQHLLPLLLRHQLQ